MRSNIAFKLRSLVEDQTEAQPFRLLERRLSQPHRRLRHAARNLFFVSTVTIPVVALCLHISWCHYGTLDCITLNSPRRDWVEVVRKLIAFTELESLLFEAPHRTQFELMVVESPRPRPPAHPPETLSPGDLKPTQPPAHPPTSRPPPGPATRPRLPGWRRDERARGG